MIKILIVDDSLTETMLLKKIFEAEPDMQVIGCAINGKDAVTMTENLKPDIITMDIQMPVMNGLEATRIIMAQFPTPIVVISSKINNEELNSTFPALEIGALSVLEKPVDIGSQSFKHVCKNIISTVRAMSEIKVIKRRFAPANHRKKINLPAQHLNRNFEILAVGTSVGGPQALKKILSELPGNFPIPIVIVQHMTQGFISGFAKWLNDHTMLHIKEAAHLEILKKGTVYFAPDFFHLEVKRVQQNLTAHLVKGEPVSGFCPSATVLLSSVAKTCGKNAIGVLLTGMGSDGSVGLLEMKNNQGHTLIQDAESTVVFGMGGVAEALGAVDKIVELDMFSDYLKKVVTTQQLENDKTQKV